MSSIDKGTCILVLIVFGVISVALYKSLKNSADNAVVHDSCTSLGGVLFTDTSKGVSLSTICIKKSAIIFKE